MLRWWPKPTILEPHMTGFSFVTPCMMAEMVLQSPRSCSSLMAAKKSAADFSVRLVLGSGIVAPEKFLWRPTLLYGREPFEAVDTRSKSDGCLELVCVQIQDFNHASGRKTNVCIVTLRG